MSATIEPFEVAHQSTVAVIFAGELRGDARVWASTRKNLIDANHAEVFAALWLSAAAECFMLQMAGIGVHEAVQTGRLALLKPMPAGLLESGTDAAVASYFGLDAETEVVHLAEPRIRRLLAQYHVLARAFELVRQTAHTTLVRARTDVAMHRPILLVTVVPGAVHMEAGKWEKRPHELAMYSHASKSCGQMPNDYFAYGSRDVMLQYAALLASASQWYPQMRRDPGVRDYRRYLRAVGLRPNETFLDNEEGSLGFYLRWRGVRCALVDAGVRLCNWRKDKGVIRASLASSGNLSRCEQLVVYRKSRAGASGGGGGGRNSNGSEEGSAGGGGTDEAALWCGPRLGDVFPKWWHAPGVYLDGPSTAGQPWKCFSCELLQYPRTSWNDTGLNWIWEDPQQAAGLRRRPWS